MTLGDREDNQTIGFDLVTTKGARDSVPICCPLLGKDPDGPAKKANWKYRSLIGMLG